MRIGYIMVLAASIASPAIAQQVVIQPGPGVPGQVNRDVRQDLNAARRDDNQARRDADQGNYGAAARAEQDAQRARQDARHDSDVPRADENVTIHVR